MRIGLVLPSVPGYSETFFVNKIRGLQSQGYELVLFINSVTTLKKFEKAHIIVAPQLSGNPLIVILKLSFSFLQLLFFHFKTVLKFYRLEYNDKHHFFSIMKKIILNSHILSTKLDWLHFGFGTMALGRENVGSAINAKTAVSYRGFDHYIFPLKNKNCYQLLFEKNVKYHVLSEGMKIDLIKKGILETQIEKITPAINLGLFTTNLIAAKTEILKIATIARLHWIKGLEYTLVALSIAKRQGLIFHYTIIGDGPEKERLQFMVYQLGLVENVAFIGKLSPEEVKKELQRADLYLQYSIQEGFCNAVLEAQAMGKICIVSDAEGLSENVVDKVTGFVVPKRDPLSLANKIIAVKELSSKEKEIISEAAINRVKSEFNIEDQIAKFIEFYENY